MKKKILIMLFLVFASICYSQYNISGINQGDDGYALEKANDIISYSVNATQYFNRMDVKPLPDTLNMIAEYIDSLTSNGIWAKRDVICLLVMNTPANAKLNVISSNFGASWINNPSYVVYGGVTTRTDNYINTNFNPTTAGGLYSQNSSSYGLWSNTNQSGVIYDFGAQDTKYAILVGNFNELFFYSNNLSGHQSTYNINTIGLLSSSRTALQMTVAYIDGDSIGVSNVQSTGMPNLYFYVGCVNINGVALYFAEKQYFYYWIGGEMTTQDEKNEYSCFMRLKGKMGF